MALGPAVRALFGRYEHEVAALYRSMFVNFDNFADVIAQWASEPRRILEVGCGEGALTERLAGLFPSAEILAIDITPRAGRLYRGRSDGVRFETIEVQKLAERGEAPFDLIILADVMHHIPGPLRPEILKSIGALMAPDGQFLMKDWGRNRAAIHWICHAADRWITGDKVHYLSADEGEGIVRQQLPALQTRARGTIRPWRNNYALFLAGDTRGHGTAPRRYLLVGAGCAILNQCILIGMDAAGFSATAAVLASFILVTPIAYNFHARWTFRTGHSPARLVRFIAGLLANLLVAMFMVWLLREPCGLPMIITAPVATVLMMILNYLSARWALLHQRP